MEMITEHDNYEHEMDDKIVAINGQSVGILPWVLTRLILVSLYPFLLLVVSYLHPPWAGSLVESEHLARWY